MRTQRESLKEMQQEFDDWESVRSEESEHWESDEEGWGVVKSKDSKVGKKGKGKEVEVNEEELKGEKEKKKEFKAKKSHISASDDGNQVQVPVEEKDKGVNRTKDKEPMRSNEVTMDEEDQIMQSVKLMGEKFERLKLSDNSDDANDRNDAIPVNANNTSDSTSKLFKTSNSKPSTLTDDSEAMSTLQNCTVVAVEHQRRMMETLSRVNLASTRSERNIHHHSTRTVSATSLSALDTHTEREERIDSPFLNTPPSELTTPELTLDLGPSLNYAHLSVRDMIIVSLKLERGEEIKFSITNECPVHMLSEFKELFDVVIPPNVVWVDILGDKCFASFGFAKYLNLMRSRLNLNFDAPKVGDIVLYKDNYGGYRFALFFRPPLRFHTPRIKIGKMDQEIVELLRTLADSGTMYTHAVKLTSASLVSPFNNLDSTPSRAEPSFVMGEEDRQALTDSQLNLLELFLNRTHCTIIRTAIDTLTICEWDVEGAIESYLQGLEIS